MSYLRRRTWPSTVNIVPRRRTWPSMAHRVADGACRICDGVHGRSRHTAYLRRCTGPSTAHVVRARTWSSTPHVVSAMSNDPLTAYVVPAPAYMPFTAHVIPATAYMGLWLTSLPTALSYQRVRAVHGVYRTPRLTWPSMTHSAADDVRRTCAYAAIYDKITFEEAERRFYEANYRLMLYVRAERVPAWRCWLIRKRCMDKFCAKITKIRHTNTGNKKTTNNDMNI